METYIKLSKLQKFPIRRDHCDKKNANPHFINGIETVMEYVEHLSENPEEVKPVRHGTWVLDNEFMPIYKCTACGERNHFDYDSAVRFPFCPFCGAGMADNGALKCPL